MTGFRTLLLGIGSGAVHREAVASAAEFARLFRLPLVGLFVEEAETLALTGFPAAFFAGTERAGGALDRRRIEAALSRERLAVRSLLEALAAEARLSCSVTVRRGRLFEVVAGEAVAGDLVVLGLDLGRRSLADMLETARHIAGRSGAVLLVPEVRPARTGAVLALPGDGPAGVLAGEIAARLHAPVILAAPGGLPAPALLAASGVRLVVAAGEAAATLDIDAGEGPVRQFRSALLVLGD
jgi:hypothetical protein